MGEFPQSHCTLPTVVDLGVHGVETTAELDSERASAVSEFVGRPLQQGFVEVAGDYFPHHAGNLHHCSCVCSPFCNIVGVHVVSGGNSKS